MEFAGIPSGTFAMGDGSDLASPNEQPVHEVTLDGCWMATTELTLKQWNAFVAATGSASSRPQARSDDHPIVGISWEDARAYGEWFSRTYGVIARFPSEAEWEYAARGGLHGRQYPNGDSISPREANFASDGAVRVAAYPPNGYGLFDMAGNVFEWVGDWYDKDYYRVSPRGNPRGPAVKDNAPGRKADRGGGWCMGVERVRVAARHAGPGSWDDGGTANCLGVRLVMEGRTAD
jgi:formylglycine-generating enzyme required for sulfatase activity